MTRPLAPVTSAGRLRAVPLFLFSLIWTAMSLGIVGVGVFWTNSGSTREGWTELPCRIERCEIRDDVKNDSPFVIEIEFRYFHAGAERIGRKIGEEEKRFDTCEDAAKLRARIMAGPEARCRVNPKNPDDAILIWNDGTAWVGKLIMGLVGVGFASIGVGLMVHSIKTFRNPLLPNEDDAPSGGSRTAGIKNAGCILIPFFGVFAMAGLGISLGVAWPMWSKYLSARSWVEVPGEVIWSKVRSHSGDGTTYSAHIYYRYTYQGKEYQSDSTSFLKGSSSGRKPKEEKVRNHPAGKPITVWVNPQNPNEAILDRRFGNWAWFTLFPLPFLAVGLGGLYFIFRKKAAASSAPSTLPGLPPARHVSAVTTADLSSSHSLRLTPGKGRATKVIGTFIFAAFWNGLISIFARDVVDGWQAGSQPWGLTLFLIPFVIVGLIALLSFPYQFGALFNPRPVVEISPASPGIGQTLSVRWEVPSGVNRLRDLRLVLRSEEAITRGSGKHARTTRTTLFEREIGRAESPETIAMGRASLRIPSDATPSKTLGERTVTWTLEVHATIPFWPDIKDSHVVEVRGNS